MAYKETSIALAVLSILSWGTFALADDVHKAGIEVNTQFTTPDAPYVPAYGAPKMIGIPMVPKHATVTPKPPPPHQIKAGIKEEIHQQPKQPPPPKPQPLPQPPLRAAVTATAPVKEGVLPAQFLGRWQVMGSRSNVESQPQFQKGIDSIFQMTTNNTWTIQGSPDQGYMLITDSGVSTALTVASQGNQAILRYAHPIKNTVAQEALVMQMTPGGAQFDGLERITIVKQGEPPRAKVTYKLLGHRQ